MNRIRRPAAILAGLAGALLAVAAVAPAALADPFPPRPPGWDKHPQLPPPGAGIHVVVVGGMPGWQIALIAIGAALLAATAAAGIIAKRGGSPVWRPRAKMSASAPPAGPPGTSRATGPSPAAARTQRHMPPRRRPRPRPVLAIGEEHRVPGRRETTHVHTHSPPGTLPAGSSATGRRATVPARRGPFFRNRRARFFTLALPGDLRFGVHRHRQGRGRVDRHLALLRPRHHHAGDHQRRIRQSRSASRTLLLHT